jgi:hypothetical protein
MTVWWLTHRPDLRLAGECPPPGRALGAPHLDVPRLLACGLAADHVKTVMKLLLTFVLML